MALIKQNQHSTVLTYNVFENLFDVPDSQIVSVRAVVDVSLELLVVLKLYNLQSRILLVFTDG